MKKIITLPLILLFTQSTFAQEKFLKKTDTIDGLVAKHFDLSGDGVIDRIESWDGDRLVKLQVDKNFTGKINEWTQYFPYKNDVTPVEIVESDTNKDGKADRKNTIYRNEKDKLWVTSNEVDSNGDGIFEKKYNTHSSLIQKDMDHCNPEAIPADSKVLTLAGQSKAASKVLINGEYVQTDFGYKIQMGCLKNWGDDFPNIVKSSISTGMQCLKKLAKENDGKGVKPNGAFSNLKNLEQLISSKGVTIACSENKAGDKKAYNWEGTNAHASTGATDEIKEFGIKHPFLSLNPNNPKVKGKGSKEELANIQNTIFHEQLHNLGIRHGEDIEAPYTCGTCCFSGSDDSAEEIEAACKICAGGYESSKDKKYINDMIAWGKTSYDSKRAIMAVANFQKEFPKDKFGIIAFADISADSFSSIGYDMAKIIKKRIKGLNSEDTKKLDEIIQMEQFNDFKNPHINKTSPVLAEAYVTAVYDQNKTKALDLIKKEGVNFKAMLAGVSKATGNDQYKLESLKESLTNQLKDIWLTDYPKSSKEDSHKAYELLMEFKLL